MKRKYNKNVINIDINEENVYADYGIDGDLLVEEDLIDNMFNVANTRPIKQGVIFCFKEKNGIDVEDSKFISAYHNTIKNHLLSKKLEIRRCILLGVVLLVASALFILLENFFFIKQGPIIAEVSNIISWVFFWAAVEVLTIDLSQLMMEKIKYIRLDEAILLFNRNKKDTD